MDVTVMLRVAGAENLSSAQSLAFHHKADHKFVFRRNSFAINGGDIHCDPSVVARSLTV